MGVSPSDEGLVAATSGMDEHDNLYAEGTGPYSEWADGFSDGIPTEDLDLKIVDDGKQYETILDQAEALRDSMRSQLEARARG